MSSLGGVAPSDAAEIHLKSGMVVRGDILERTSEFIRLKTTFDVEIQYYVDEINYVKDEKSPPQITTQSTIDIPTIPTETSSLPKPVTKPLRKVVPEDIKQTKIPSIDIYEIVPELRKTEKIRERTNEIDSTALGADIDAEGYYNLGVTAAEIGEYQNAKINFLKAVNMDSSLTDAYYNLGLVCGHLGKFQEAVEYLERAILLDPNPPDAYFSLGEAYAAMSQFDKAQKNFERAIEIDPAFYEAYYKLGIVYASRGDYDQARMKLRTYIEKKPEAVKGYYQMGLVAATMKQDVEAIRFFKKSVELEPEFGDAYYNLGVVYGSNGQYDKAIDQFQQAVVLGNENPDVYYNLAMAHLGTAQNSVTVGALGAYKKARESFNRAKDLYSTNTDYDTIRKIDEILLEIPE